MIGVIFDTLKNDMTLEIVTHNSSYCIRRDHFATWIVGGIKKDGSVRYPTWSSIRIIGSSFPQSPTRLGYIGKNMILSFYEHGRERVLTTSSIQSIALVYEHTTYQI